MRQTYSNLYLAILTREQHERMCGYWYTITNHCTAHTAFATEAGVWRWANERGLQLSKSLTQPSEFSTQRIIGTYHTEAHMNEAEFYGVDNVVMLARTMSNGDLTLAIITEENGERTVHTLNPNVKSRPIFPYNSQRD